MGSCGVEMTEMTYLDDGNLEVRTSLGKDVGSR